MLTITLYLCGEKGDAILCKYHALRYCGSRDNMMAPQHLAGYD